MTASKKDPRCCGLMFLVESHIVRLTRVVELDSDDVVWGVHAHQVMHADEHTRYLRSNILFMSSPRSFIRGLLCTAMITSHTVIKASLVHFSLKTL